jgi:hypothetical protein
VTCLFFWGTCLWAQTSTTESPLAAPGVSAAPAPNGPPAINKASPYAPTFAGASAGKKASGDKPAAQGPDSPGEISVRVALIASPDRVYLFGLAGPDGPFSKMEPRFDEVLASVKLNYEFH